MSTTTSTTAATTRSDKPAAVPVGAVPKATPPKPATPFVGARTMDALERARVALDPVTQ